MARLVVHHKGTKFNLPAGVPGQAGRPCLRRQKKRPAQAGPKERRPVRRVPGASFSRDVQANSSSMLSFTARSMA
jgi:hypothetical protein